MTQPSAGKKYDERIVARWTFVLFKFVVPAWEAYQWGGIQQIPHLQSPEFSFFRCNWGKGPQGIPCPSCKGFLRPSRYLQHGRNPLDRCLRVLEEKKSMNSKLFFYLHAVYSRTSTLDRPGLVRFSEGPAYSPPGQKFSGSTVLVPLEIPSI